MLTPEQVATIREIVGVFETGMTGGGDPSAVVVLPDGAGISYGMHQATEKSGSLDVIVREYIRRGGRFPDAFLAGGRRDTNLLRLAGAEDPIMRQVQLDVFDKLYWIPCVHKCETMDLEHALSWLAVYDTCVQSGPEGVERIRRRFVEAPPSRGGEEKWWTTAYIRARFQFLHSFEGKLPAHSRLVQRTVYRPNTLEALADAGNWALDRPILVMGHTLE